MASAAQPDLFRGAPLRDATLSPFDRLTHADTLRAAWEHVRASARASSSLATRAEALRFEPDAARRLAALGDEIAAGRFEFGPAFGVASPRPGKRPRPLVIAPIESRIVTRALLRVLLDIPAVAELAGGAPHSFGGLPGRGVPQAIAAALAAAHSGAAFHLRTDIADFFGSIPRDRAVAAVAGAAGDARVARALTQATAAELANRGELGGDAELFPGERRGVAQGNALSTLLGNVLLRDFDERMNGRGIVCLRYVDDILLLGPRAKHVRRAFESARRLLADLGLDAYDPERDPRKAALGPVAGGIAWLGCELRGGAARPSIERRRALLDRVDRALGGDDLAAALAGVEREVRAFRGAYAFCACPEVFAALDEKIGRRVERAFLRRRARVGPGLSRTSR